MDLVTILRNIDWNSLFSGFIGAVTGALSTFLITRWQITKSLRLQRQWERERIEAQSVVRQQSIVHNLIGELEANVAVTKNAHGRYTWIKLLCDLWTLSKGEVLFLPAKTQDLIRDTYTYLQRYNDAIEDRRTEGNIKDAGWDTLLESELKCFRDKAEQSLEQLRKWSQSR